MRKTIACLGAATLVSGKVYFSETFDDKWQKRWVKSTWKESEGTHGKWTLAAGKWAADETEDRGLKTAEDSKHFTISAAFPSFSNLDKELIVQYQAKYENDVECGGGYVKLGPKMEDQTKFGDPTVYNIMFGPDKCGADMKAKRTHLIFNYKGKHALKKNDLAWKQEGDGISHLYRLIVKPDNTVRVEIDGLYEHEGPLDEGWELGAPKTIEDPNDKKPSDWVDKNVMDDPESFKPDDWVPRSEKRIVDPDAKKPTDWDDEEDGEWEVPMKDNPAYKGEWHVHTINNPAFKGHWDVAHIDNPEYEHNHEAYAYDDFSYIGFDLWQVKGGTIFDNIIITDDIEEADAFAEKWKDLSAHQKAMKTKENNEGNEDDKKNEDEQDADDDDDDNKDQEEV